MIEIRRYESGLLSSNMYVIVEGNHAIVIDPFEDTTPAAGLIVDYILLTHEHYDHISGVNTWKELTGATVLCSRACAENIEDPKTNLAKYFREFCELQKWAELKEIPEYDPSYSCSADLSFEKEMVFDWMGHNCQLLEMPGHSMGSIGILIDDSFFFSGDSLMENSEIALRFPGGSRAKWIEEGKSVLTRLSAGTMVYPGHFREFTYLPNKEYKKIQRKTEGE